MDRLPDLVRDSKLETRFLSTRITRHVYYESGPTTRERAIPREEHWKRVKEVGRGAYGNVWLEQCVKGQKHIEWRAVKRISKLQPGKPVNYYRELEAIAKFSHQKYRRCFVESFGWYERPDELFITMEYFEQGDLQHHLFDEPPLPESEAQQITFQLLEGLFFLHDNGFAHRDLKPANILLKSKPPEPWWVKIGDFGITKRTEDGVYSSKKGTLAFMAPELHGFTKAGKKLSSDNAQASDIWSLGELAFRMLTKEPTFSNLGCLSSYVQLPHSFPTAPLHAHSVSPSGVYFIKSTMTPSPEERPTAENALQHNWIQSCRSSSPRASSTASTESLLLQEKSSPTEPDFLAEPSASWSDSIHDRQPSSSTTITAKGAEEQARLEDDNFSSEPTIRRAKERPWPNVSPRSPATPKYNFTEVHSNQGNMEDAEQVPQLAPVDYKKALGSDHHSTSTMAKELTTERSIQNPSVVVGIDFGMTSTAVAFSVLETTGSSPRPETIQHWPGIPDGVRFERIDTMIAYNIYTDEVATWGFTVDPDDRNCRIEELFKLYLNPDFRDGYRYAPSLEEARRWYTDYLACLYRHINRFFSDSLLQLNAMQVEWVFSVPTSWKNPAMIAETEQLIKNAGFGREQNHHAEITLTEAEATAIHLTENHYQKGDVFLMCDAGGGTTDVNILKATYIGHSEFEVLLSVEGRPIGSILIDVKMEKRIIERLESFRDFLDADPKVIAQEMMRNKFQSFKCNFGDETTDVTYLGLFIPDLKRAVDFPSAGIVSSHMIITRNELKGLFDEQIERIFKFIDEQLRKLQQTHPREKVQFLGLSGELSDSPYVQKMVRSRYETNAGGFPNAKGMQILRCAKPQVGVVHGLVMNRVQHIREVNIVNTSRQVYSSSPHPEIRQFPTHTATSKLREFFSRGKNRGKSSS